MDKLKNLIDDAELLDNFKRMMVRKHEIEFLRIKRRNIKKITTLSENMRPTNCNMIVHIEQKQIVNYTTVELFKMWNGC